MKVRKPLLFVAAAAAAVLFPLRAAQAAGYNSQIIEDDVNPTDIHMDGCTPGSGTIGNQTVGVLKCKPSSSVLIAASPKPGDGGIAFTLKMKKVSCTNGGAAKCNATGHVFELQLRALKNDIPCGGVAACNGALPFEAAAGIQYDLAAGSAGFPAASGKNKIGAGTIFGLLSSQIFTRSVGIGQVRLHKTGTKPADCKSAPLLDGNGCIDGDIYAVAGFAVPLDSGNICHANTDCPPADDCIAPGICNPTTCTSVSDCRTTTGYTLGCDVNGTGNCCICVGTATNPASCAAGVCP